AIQALMEDAKAGINRIASNPEPPTFTNTVAALEYSGKPMSRVTEAFFNINSAETSDYLQELAQKIAFQLADFSNDILLNADLFQRIKAVYDRKEDWHLDDEEQRQLLLKYRNFVRNGALLPDDQQKILRELDQQLSTLQVQFSQNV